MITIGIVGSRRRDSDADFEAVECAFAKIWRPGDEIVSGGCPKGADSFAEDIASVTPGGPHFIPLHIHYPDQSKLDPVLLKKNRRAAYAQINYARNTLIARDAEVLIACVAPDRQGGTEDTIRKFCRKYQMTEAALVAAGKLILV